MYVTVDIWTLFQDFVSSCEFRRGTGAGLYLTLGPGVGAGSLVGNEFVEVEDAETLLALLPLCWAEAIPNWRNATTSAHHIHFIDHI